MQVFSDFSQLRPDFDTVLTVGTFDGVHIGHQVIIRTVVQRARDMQGVSTAVTFHLPPRAVLRPNQPIPYLTNRPERERLFAELGLDRLIVLWFTMDMAKTTATEFVDRMCSSMRIKELWVGEGFTLGKDREGTGEFLTKLGQERGFTVHVVPPMTVDAERVSSTSIRRYLAVGQVERVTRLLGRFPSLTGRVVEGARRGRTLGFPTANVQVEPGHAIPGDGIYAIFVRMPNGERREAVVNVGTRPTFDNGERTVEAFILDYDGDLYGQELKLEFVARLRPELRFASVPELIAQMHEDVRRSRQILAGHAEPGQLASTGDVESISKKGES